MSNWQIITNVVEGLGLTGNKPLAEPLLTTDPILHHTSYFSVLCSMLCIFGRVMKISMTEIHVNIFWPQTK